MCSLLFVEAFGQLIRDESLEGVVSDEEDLYSVFRARAQLMGWSTTKARRRPLLWQINEAELTAGSDESRVGWVQVGLEVGDVEPTMVQSAPVLPVLGYRYAPLGVHRRAVEPALILGALVQCFDDALRRFGVVELYGFQVAASGLESSAQSWLNDLGGTLNWFNTTLKGQADAVIAFDQEFLGGHAEAELAAGLRRRNKGSFEFGPVVAVPKQHSVKAGVETPIRSISPAQSGLGLTVSLPEWTASAVGWALAMVVDAARAIAPDVSNFAVRITRVR